MVPTACQDMAGLALGMLQAVSWPFPRIPPCSAGLGKGKMKLLVCLHLEFDSEHLLLGRGWRGGEGLWCSSGSCRDDAEEWPWWPHCPHALHWGEAEEFLCKTLLTCARVDEP